MLAAYCRLYHHCRNLAEGGCLLSRFHFTCCRYVLGHVACRQGLCLNENAECSQLIFSKQNKEKKATFKDIQILRGGNKIFNSQENSKTKKWPKLMFAFHTFLNNFSNNLLYVNVFTCLSLIMVAIYVKWNYHVYSREGIPIWPPWCSDLSCTDPLFSLMYS